MCREIGGTLRTSSQKLEQIKLNTGGQRLRINKTGAQIEQSPRLAAGNRAGERKAGGEGVETRVRQKAIAVGKQRKALLF